MPHRSLPAGALRLAWRLLRSVAAVGLAVTCLVAIPWGSGVLAGGLSLPAGGEPRLAWDLAVVFLAGTVAFAVLTRLAPTAPGAHAVAGFVLLAGITGWAAWSMGQDFPAWFTGGLLLALPMLAWLGWRVGAGSRR